jgi:hypothetical protein
MVLVGPCVDHLTKYLKKAISIKMGHTIKDRQGVLKKEFLSGSLRCVQTKISLRCVESLNVLVKSVKITGALSKMPFVKPQFFKLFAKLIVIWLTETIFATFLPK